MELIERNRILLTVKHFPPGMIISSFGFFFLRLAAGALAAIRGKGETRHYAGIGGKFVLMRSFLRANIEAAKMVPAMLRKRRQLRPLRKLNSRQVKELLARHRISLRALTERAN
jgi:hypothetical protein